jgi:hypothetical protein
MWFRRKNFHIATYRTVASACERRTSELTAGTLRREQFGISKLRYGSVCGSVRKMGKLVYGMMQSLDGYVADAAGRLQLPPPGAALDRHFNDHVRNLAGILYGRRM